MPRRIPDYPDCYVQWNKLASFGSMVSVLSTLLFFYIIYLIFFNNTLEFNYKKTLLSTSEFTIDNLKNPLTKLNYTSDVKDQTILMGVGQGETSFLGLNNPWALNIVYWTLDSGSTSFSYFFTHRKHIKTLCV